MANEAHSRAKRGVLFLLRMSGVPFLIRELAQRRRVTILCYHQPSAEVATRHFEALRRRYSIISLSDYLSFRAGTQKQLPPKPLIITLDDGHMLNYSLKPIFEKYRIQPTVFLCSGVVGTKRGFWFETEMNDGVRQSLKWVSDEQRLQILARMGFSETGEASTRQALSAIEIQDMKSIVDFQSHTVYHPLLPQCSAPRAVAEISDSKAELENKFGLSIYALAYPNGDYSAREIAAAEASGYKCALTLDPGFNSRATPAFRLKRFCINDDAGVNELLVKTSGLWGFLKSVKRVLAIRSRRAAGEYSRLDHRSVPS